MFKKIIYLTLIISSLASCKSSKSTESDSNELTLYTHRHYDADKEIIKDFEEETGIKVKVVNAGADELIQKLETEGEQSPADLLITVDAGRLVRAKNKGLLQSVDSELLESSIPSHLQDPDNQWFAVTKRARVIVYDKNDVDPEQLSTYEALANPEWKDQVLIRSSGNIYNQSLMASMIANEGVEEAKLWATGVVNNFARNPKGNDRDQVKGILAGEGDLAVVNTYYIGKLLNSNDQLEKDAGNAVGTFFPNQDGRGAHINVSGIGLTRHSPNKMNAVKFMEYLASKDVQEKFATANYEYPVNKEASVSELLQSWGNFKEDQLSLTKLGELNKQAVIIFDEVKWP